MELGKEVIPQGAVEESSGVIFTFRVYGSYTEVEYVYGEPSIRTDRSLSKSQQEQLIELADGLFILNEL